MFNAVASLVGRRWATSTRPSLRRVPFVSACVTDGRSAWTVCGGRRLRPVLVGARCPSSPSRRYKRTTHRQDDSDSDGDDDDSYKDSDVDNDSGRPIKFRTSTMRMDSVLKHALGKSRNKIEVAFYESRIRVNGKKVTKKSHSVNVGDEIDLVRGPSPNNPDFLIVSRVEVVSSKLDGDELEVKLKKFKNLLINNYDDKWNSAL